MLITVSDKGMHPRIIEGDRVEIDTDTKKVREGDIVAVWKNGKIFIRRIYLDGDGFLLVADNPEYQPIKARNYEILGIIAK